MSSLIGFKISQPGTEENAHVNKKGKTASMAQEKPIRKSLQILQSSADDKQLTRDVQLQKSGKPQKITPSSKPVVVFTDEDTTTQKPSKENCSCQCHPSTDKQETTQDTTQDRAMVLMGPGEPGVEYWQDLAEQRRQALTDALEENEQLHTEIFQLREENENLTEMAEKAEYFANLFKTLTEEKYESDTEETE